MDDELLDLVDKDDNVIGTIFRSVAQNDPTKIYRIVSITVFNEDGETLIQKRSKDKSHPGKWENAASGHVLANEKPEDAAKRELFEELGIDTEPIYFDKWFIAGDNKNKFMWMYYIVVPKSINISFNLEEIEEIKWIKPEYLPEFALDNLWDVSGYSHKEITDIYNKIIKQ